MTSQIRYSKSQQNRSLIHPTLPQPDNNEENKSNHAKISKTASTHSFVVCADTQYGMTSGCKEWETEMEYSRQAIHFINSLEPRPLFCCMCGDLVDMEYTFFEGKGFTRQECDTIQDQQNSDFKSIWSELHDDIAMVCLCGNHDIGNRPTKASIEKFTNAFGDDYLAFWVNGTYNIVLNSTLFTNPSGAEDLYAAQLEWLEGRLKYASQEQSAAAIFVFGHHPWFLYHENETDDDLKGESPYPKEWGERPGGFPDRYFVVPIQYRKKVMQLFQSYNVTAAFSGHFHQNLVSKASFGMDMIITSSLSMVFQSSSKTKEYMTEPSSRGVRVVQVSYQNNNEGDADDKPLRTTFTHKFHSL